jgi:hypothetical protein
VQDLNAVKDNDNNWTATVTVTVHSSENNPVSGAAVTGQWNGDNKKSSSCTTGASGTCQVTLKGNDNSKTFAVTGITGSMTYASGDNVVTQITITRTGTITKQ